MTLTEEQRRQLMRESKASAEQSGNPVSDAFDADGELYIKGEITADELLWRTLTKKKGM